MGVRRPIRVGLLGIGTVGSGTFAVLERNREEIARRAGRRLEIAWVAARNLDRARGIVGPDVRVTGDVMQIVTDAQIDIVVEVIGGTTVARQAIMTAIEHGKHIVTDNKSFKATEGNEIFTSASRHNVMVAFEGAVSV
ncbi:MAG: homoserine dehydrogenase, partial [Candidatus Eremiobacteraeota bacterium]|nr:homoserine dehydrogenase [Candidatus Eremiobacteraeota bacterium]